MSFASTTSQKFPILENGDRVTRDEFERRYHRMPNVKKAELLEGTVYRQSPVRVTRHAQPHSLIIAWLINYEMATPHLMVCDNINFSTFCEIIEEHYSSNGTKKWAHDHIKAGGFDPNTFYSEFKAFCGKMEQGTIREFVEAFFRFCYGEGAYLLGDKTPFYGMYMAKILELWPDAKFIHLVRDGRYTATSMQKHKGFLSFSSLIN